MKTHVSTSRRARSGLPPATWTAFVLVAMVMAFVTPQVTEAAVPVIFYGHQSNFAANSNSVSVEYSFPDIFLCPSPAMVMRVAIRNQSSADAPTVSSITWTASGPAQNLSYATTGSSSNGENHRKRTEIWLLAGPNPGSGTATVSLSGSADVVADLVAACLVNQADPAAPGSTGQATSAAGTTAASAPFSTQGGLVLDMLAIDDSKTATAVDPSRTVDVNAVGVPVGAPNLTAYSSHYTDADGLFLVNPRWSLSAADFWVDSGVVLKPGLACAPGTATLGYWKTHPEAWPVDSITVGGVVYTKDQAIDIMSTPSRGDKTYDLFKQLVSAMLNVMVGNDSSCISSDITAANSWLVAHPLGSKVKAKDWNPISATHDRLDDYNNGWLCAPYRGTVQCGGS